MPLSFGQQERLNEPMPLQKLLAGTSFVSTTGRIYHLFGNEEKAFSLPDIPAIPPFSVSPKPTPHSLEEALQEMDAYALQTGDCAASQISSGDSTAILISSGDCAALHPRLLSRPIPAKDILDEVSSIAPKPIKKRQIPLRIVSDPSSEPFIVPFAKPVLPPKESETKKITLKVVPEFVPPTLVSPRAFRTCWQRRHKEKILYRNALSLPAQPAGNDSNTGSDHPLTFQWSALSDSLKKTAANQIQMLADHLIVQSNQDIKRICFKGIFPEDGCSTILLCAVRALTERQHRILLIDAHHRHIDLPNQLNLPDTLDAGKEIVALNEHLDLWIWQESRTADENMASLAKILSTCREDYDLILLDTGSLTERPLSEFVDFWNRIEADGIILVSNMKHPQELPMSHVADRLRQNHIHLIGIIENHV